MIFLIKVEKLFNISVDMSNIWIKEAQFLNEIDDEIILLQLVGISVDIRIRYKATYK